MLGQVAHHARTITMSDPALLKALIEAEKPDLVVPEIEAIAIPMLEVLEATGVVRVIPTARAARLTMGLSAGQSETVEGIRALAVDKDNAPHWNPARIEDVTAAMVAPYFCSPWTRPTHPLRDLT